ncbi:hypothetical protein Bbelb_175850, partial [Branchiostoma belcheri]
MIVRYRRHTFHTYHQTFPQTEITQSDWHEGPCRCDLLGFALDSDNLISLAPASLHWQQAALDVASVCRECRQGSLGVLGRSCNYAEIIIYICA